MNPTGKLMIDLIPESSFFKNLRSEAPQHWDALRKACYRKAGYRCEICGGVGDKHPVECHELWGYEDGTQRLVRLIALCPACHEVHHIGLAQMRGTFDRAFSHLQAVNGWSALEAQAHIEMAFRKWRERSRVRWNLDISAVLP